MLPAARATHSFAGSRACCSDCAYAVYLWPLLRCGWLYFHVFSWIEREMNSDQTVKNKQCWWNMNQDSVTVLPILLQFLDKIYCWYQSFENLWNLTSLNQSLPNLQIVSYQWVWKMELSLDLSSSVEKMLPIIFIWYVICTSVTIFPTFSFI